MKNNIMKIPLLDYLEQLSEDDKKDLYQLLRKDLHGITLENIKDIRSEQIVNKPISCPHCNSEKIIGFGSYREKKRFRCKSCSKTFNEMTGTPMSNLKKTDKFSDYLELFSQRLSLRDLATKLEISVRTAFDWRHKILTALSNYNGGYFDGIVESDDKQFEFSEKGRKDLKRKPYKRPSDREKEQGNTNKKVVVVVSSDRKNNRDITLAKFGRIDKKSLATIFEEKITDKNKLCTDSHYSYRGWANDSNIEHHYFTANQKKHVKDKVYHIQHVNSLDNKMERWFKKFWGVATKYLQGYLNWFKIEEKLKNSENILYEFITILVSSNKSFIQFRTIEQSYQVCLNAKRFI